jgi:DNA-binding response OmpR family regulator
MSTVQSTIRSNAPMIDQCNESDRVVALELEADDDVTKRFGPGESLACNRGALRRQTLGQARRARDPMRGGVCFSGRRLESRARRLLDPMAMTLSVTKGEFAFLIAALMSE